MYSGLCLSAAFRSVALETIALLNAPIKTGAFCCISLPISKHSPFDIAPLFKEAVHIKNINLPLSFWDVLNGGIQARIKQVAEKESPSVSDFCQRTGLSFTIIKEYMCLFFCLK